MPISRVLRRINDMLAHLELVAVRCARCCIELCIEGFTAAGFALHGYPPDLYGRREGSSECEEEALSERKKNESPQYGENDCKKIDLRICAPKKPTGTSLHMTKSRTAR
jgi:hypothetical protein